MDEKIRIAICDDEHIQLNNIACIVRTIGKEVFGLTEVCTYESINQLVQDFQNKVFHLVLLDIQMTEMNGFEAAKKLQKIMPGQAVIFITSEFDLVFDCFGYSPLAFVRKRSEEQMTEDLRVAFRWFNEVQVINQELIFNTANGMIEKIQKSEILWFQSNKNYIECHIRKGNLFKVRKTLSQQEEELQGSTFVRINRSVLVNLRYVEKIDIKKRLVIGKEIGTLDLTKTYAEEVLKKYMDYRMGE